MKLWATILEDEWLLLEPYITCEYQNPMDDEFVFWDPTPMLFWRLAAMGIPFGISDS